MRIVTPITVLALAGAGAVFGGGWSHLDSISERLDMPFSRDATEAEVALEVRCGELDSWMRRTCEDELSQRFASGNADPEAVLRMHCTRARTVWEQNMPTPPALCAARFGGWLSS
jgi:hypothetical protein